MTGEESAALEAEFAAKLTAGLARCQSDTLITALSGGADSTALCLLAARYAARHHLHHRAVIIDHGLRAESAAEAARVAARMQAHNIPAEIIRITDKPTAGGVQEWARHVRYDALFAAARPTNAVVLLGHHAGDQAETVAMRLSRGSGLAGLGAMGLHTTLMDVHMLRPMLDWSADRPAALCRFFGSGFETDPSNIDRRFERVRVRQMLRTDAAHSNAVGSPSLSDQLTRLAGLASRLCAAVDRPLASYYPAIRPAGFARLDPACLMSLSHRLWNRLLSRLIQQIAAPAYPPSSAALTKLRNRLGTAQAATLAGCKFTPTNDGYLVTREIGRHPGALTVAAEDCVCFDGLWRLTIPVAGTLRLWGAAPAPSPQQDDRTTAILRDIRQNIPHLARIAIPVLDTLDGQRLYPQLDGMVSPVMLAAEMEPGFTASFLATDKMNDHYNAGQDMAYISGSVAL